MLGILYIFKPIKLPEFFNFDFGEDINEDIKTYKCKIEKSDNFHDLKCNLNINKKDLKVYFKENFPFIIVNPFFPEKVKGNNIDTYIFNIEIGYFSEN